MPWQVHMNGKYINIVETNYEYASAYWRERSKESGERFTLVRLDKPKVMR